MGMGKPEGNSRSLWVATHVFHSIGSDTYQEVSRVRSCRFCGGILVLRNRIHSGLGRAVICGAALLLILTVILCISGLTDSGRSQASDKESSVKYYTSLRVEKGDTLWDIARANISREYENLQAYINELKQINRLTENEIHAGQYLSIPYYSKKAR